jgi:signal recognition particle subunit SRP72
VTGSDLEFKLNFLQLKTIAFNEILFSILTNQVLIEEAIFIKIDFKFKIFLKKDTSYKLLEQFKAKFNDKECFTFLKVVQLMKEKKYSEAENIIREFLNEKSQLSSSNLKYILIQNLLLSGNIEGGINAFELLDEYKDFKLGAISSLISLFKYKNEKESISRIFSQAIDCFSKIKRDSKELEIYTKENANFQMSCNNLETACEMLEKMFSYKPNDYKILSKLINIYSKIDVDKAKALSEKLPSLDSVLENSDIDIENLETQFSLMNSKYGKSKISVALGTETIKPLGSNKQHKEILQNKKKRKTILPKNYNPNIALDTERWLPLRERSYYKGKRRKRNTIGKGTQGAVSTK